MSPVKSTEEKNLQRRVDRALKAAIAKRKARSEPVTEDAIVKDVMESRPDLHKPLARAELTNIISAIMQREPGLTKRQIIRRAAAVLRGMVAEARRERTQSAGAGR